MEFDQVVVLDAAVGDLWLLPYPRLLLSLFVGPLTRHLRHPLLSAHVAHGMSGDTMGLCGQHTWKQPVPQGFGVRHVMNPDPYRGPFGNDGKK